MAGHCSDLHAHAHAHTHTHTHMRTGLRAHTCHLRGRAHGCQVFDTACAPSRAPSPSSLARSLIMCVCVRVRVHNAGGTLQVARCPTAPLQRIWGWRSGSSTFHRAFAAPVRVNRAGMYAQQYVLRKASRVLAACAHGVISLHGNGAAGMCARN